MRPERSLSAGDLAGVAALEADRDGDAEGIPAAELRMIVGTRFLPSFISRLREHGYVIGISSAGRYELGHNEPTSTGASDERRPASSEGCGPAPAGPIGQASDAPVEAELALFESSAYHRREAA